MPETEKKPVKRVWVIGAGFSRSLGGPLLDHLLAPNAYFSLQEEYREVFKGHEDLYEVVFWLFNYGCGFRHGAINPRLTAGVKRWQDAEEFLELLDIAVDKPDTVGAELQKLWGSLQSAGALLSSTHPVKVPGFPKDLKELRRMARNLVAAGCSAFVEGIKPDDDKLERWEPYETWFEQLGGNDSIVTFNYDRVIELLSTDGIVTAEFDAHAQKEQARGAAEDDLPMLYKLHGSVHWEVKDGEIHRHGEWKPSLLGMDHEIAIATPGAEKRQMTGTHFTKLWTAAEARLAEADRVYFLGYRFPPSDASARGKLVSGLGKNKSLDLRVHTVLGDDARGAVRLAELLKWKLNINRDAVYSDGKGQMVPWTVERQILVHPLNVEDFLYLWGEHEKAGLRS